MEYFFQRSTTSKTLVVGFHGRGGNQYQLLTLIARLYPDASILTYLGDVEKGKARRYFKPLEKGQLDRQDFQEQVEKFLTKDWKSFAGKYEKVVLVGFSNGANFILGLLEQAPTMAQEYLILHPSPLDFQFHPKNPEAKIILTTGSMDTKSIPGEILKLQQMMKAYFPKTQLIIVDGKHAITEEELLRLEKNIE